MERFIYTCSCFQNMGSQILSETYRIEGKDETRLIPEGATIATISYTDGNVGEYPTILISMVPQTAQQNMNHIFKY